MGSGEAYLQEQPHQLIGTEHQHTEHQMAHHLGGALHAHLIAAELVLEPRVAALGDGALVVAHGVRRIERLLESATWIVIDQRYVVQAPAVLVQIEAAVGGVHHIVEIGHALGADQRQGDRGAAVVHRGRGQQRRYRHPTVGGVEMQLVAVPADLVALRIGLRAAITGGRNLRQHLSQALSALALDRRARDHRALFITPWSTPFRARCMPRHRIGRRCRRTAHRSLARLDRRAVAADVTDQLITEMRLDQRLMHTLGQLRGRKLLESPRKRGFRGQLAVQRESANPPQSPIDHQSLDQRRGRGQPQRRLGHEGIREPRPIVWTASDAAPGRGNEFLDPHPLQQVDQSLELRRRRAEVLLQFGKHFVLDDMPALQDQVSTGSIHGVGDMVLDLTTASCQKWPPTLPSLFARHRKKSTLPHAFCKRLVYQTPICTMLRWRKMES